MPELVTISDALPRRVVAVRLHSGDDLPVLPHVGPIAPLIVTFDPEPRRADLERWVGQLIERTTAFDVCGPGADAWEGEGWLADQPWLLSPASAIEHYFYVCGEPFDVTAFPVLVCGARDADWQEVLSCCQHALQETVDDRLHHAAGLGDLDKVRTAIAHGWPLDSLDRDLGWSPLHHAAKEGQLEVVRLLLAAGVNVDARDENRLGETALRIVVEDGELAVAAALLEAGANPHLRGMGNMSALDWTAQRKGPSGLAMHRLVEEHARRSGRPSL
jgi:hypothetical protein